MYVEIKSKVISGNAYYYLVQNFISSFFPRKIHMQSIILHVVSYGCITWFLMLREQHRLRVFKKRVLTMMFGAEVGGNKRMLWLN